jgi:hypothetical protein
VWSDALNAGQIAMLAETEDSIMPTPTEPPGCIRGTATPTRTPDVWAYWTLAPRMITATGTPGTPVPASGQAVGVAYTFTTGEIAVTAMSILGVSLFILVNVINWIRRR